MSCVPPAEKNGGARCQAQKSAAGNFHVLASSGGQPTEQLVDDGRD
jgi:hypothetical protein